jgi:hypothetical protein
MIAAIIPAAAVGNTLPNLVPVEDEQEFVSAAPLMLANLNSTPFDYVARQKVQGQHLNWYIVEQLPVVPLTQYKTMKFGSKNAAEIVQEIVLELTYTANDLAEFARDMNYTDNSGNVKPPFAWDDDRRLKLRAKLDAVFFHLYGITNREDVKYIYSTFPIVEEQEKKVYGTYRSLELCLAYMNALSSGQPDAEPVV